MHTNCSAHNKLHHSIKHIQLFHTSLTKSEKYKWNCIRTQSTKSPNTRIICVKGKYFYDWYLLRSSLGGLFGFGGGRSAGEKRFHGIQVRENNYQSERMKARLGK